MKVPENVDVSSRSHFVWFLLIKICQDIRLNQWAKSPPSPNSNPSHLPTPKQLILLWIRIIQYKFWLTNYLLVKLSALSLELIVSFVLLMGRDAENKNEVINRCSRTGFYLILPILKVWCLHVKFVKNTNSL
jgi:hypothetical protein